LSVKGTDVKQRKMNKFNSISKKMFIFAAVCIGLMIIGVCVQSCESNDAAKLLPEQKAYIEKYAFVGEQHNADMQKIAERLEIIKARLEESSLDNSSNDVVDVVKSVTMEVVGSESFSSTEDFNNFFDEIFSFPNGNVTPKSITDSIIRSSDLSSDFKLMYKKLIEISDNYDLSIEQEKKAVDSLTQFAFALLKAEELDYYLIGASVSVASFEYWHTNIEQWQQLFEEHGIGATPKVSLKGGSGGFWTRGIYSGMSGADVGGAITGAIAGAGLGGIGAAPGALAGAVGGGIGASTGQVINNIGSHFGWW
jgi:hypothetical protein